jgi:thiamine pyrophosphate-dependent acetolactate synthase large subunit-like protein
MSRPVMSRTGASLVVDALVQAGVTRIFSVSGNQILSLYDATIGRGIDVIHTRHEAAAVHMADAWGRLTEAPGVALVTAGPGHANALSALYGALMAESPMLLLSGHAPRAQAGLGAFQEMDQVALAHPVTKAAWLADDATRLGDDIATALDIARRGCPGPVHVSLPGDLLDARVDAAATAAVSTASERHGATRPLRASDSHAPANDDALSAILALLADAERPLILTGPSMGRGPRWAAADGLSAATDIPALPIESPRGVNDPWLHGASRALVDADVVLLLGKPLDFSLRFGAPPAFSPACRFVQIAAAAPVPAKSSRIAIAVDADPWPATEHLARMASSRRWKHRAWRERVLTVRRTLPAEWDALGRSARTPIHPLAVCAAIRPLVERGAVFVSDGGEFGQWAQAGVEATPRLFNGLSGSIGSAVPMAVAAKLRFPDRPVIVTVGDGTFGFHGFELDTALRYRLPIVVVVGNDARWNAEYQLQVQHYGADRAIGCELTPARYDLVAAALGGHGELVERVDQLEPALARALASGRPACVNVLIEAVPAPTFGRGTGH